MDTTSFGIIEARRERKQPRNISTECDNNRQQQHQEQEDGKNKTKQNHLINIPERRSFINARDARAMCQNIFSTADPLKILYQKEKKGPAQYNRDPALLMGWSLVCILIAASHHRENNNEICNINLNKAQTCVCTLCVCV